MSMATLASLREQPQQVQQTVSMNMDTVGGFESLQRAAKLFASSSIVPKQYQGNLANCFIAVDMALRMGANPLLVMQNLYIVHGNPAWSGQFLVATFNKCGRFSAIRYEFSGDEKNDSWGCRAVATELATGQKLVGPLITIELAKKEGWYGKPGSKWQTMPEMMLRYRAAAWFVRAYAPEIAMGLQTAEEVRDSIIDVTPDSGQIILEDLKADTPEPAQEEKPKRNGKRKSSNEVKGIEDVGHDSVTVHESEVVESVPVEAATSVPEPQVEKQVDNEVKIQCPKTNEDGSFKMVSSEDCWYCKDQADCPEYQNANF